MKCPHCSASVGRREWFCPRCKRSVPRRARRFGRVQALESAGAIALIVGLLVWRPWAPPAGTPEDGPEVSVRPAPVISVRPPEERRFSSLPTDSPTPPRQSALRQAQSQVRPSPAPAPAPPAAQGGLGAVTVLTVPPVPTFVYLNGGSLLGQTPLRDASIPAGRHTLVFWSPSVGGRSTRTVDVEAGNSVLLIENVRHRDRFEDGPGG